MDENTFLQMLQAPESNTLDFKRDNYNLSKGNIEAAAAFVKDIISLANTIRSKSAYIILGVKESNGEKDLIGLGNVYDDTIYQSKISLKVTPRPVFTYETFEYGNMKFGVIEIPVSGYQKPIVPLSEMPKLKAETVYFRKGSTNTEATHIEALQINEWLSSLPSHADFTVNKGAISELLKSVSANSNSLSSELSEALRISISLKDKELETFCRNEIEGYDSLKGEINEDIRHYRTTKAYCSPGKLHNGFGGPKNATELWRLLEKDEWAFEIDLFVSEGITLIEHYIEDYARHGQNNTYTTHERYHGEAFPNSQNPDVRIYVYSRFENYLGVHRNIRNELIQMLTKRM